MRGWALVPVALVAIVVIALPVIALTETGFEKDVKEAAGFDLGECKPITNLASEWSEGPELDGNRDEPRAINLDGYVYLVGGTIDVENTGEGKHLLLTASDRLTRFDPRSGRYTDLAPLPEALNHIGIATHDGAIYVAGGYGRRTNADTSDRFYRYDVAADRWARLPNMPAPRAATGVGAIGDRLIVAGGALDSVARSQTFAYDFARRRWSRLPDMPSRREHVGATVAGGKLYVLGGRSPNSLAVDTAERFDPRTGTWEELPAMPVPTGGLAAATVDGDPIAIGGGDDGAATVTGAVQVFDPAGGEWARISDLRTPRHGHGAALVNGEIWVFGGSACAYLNATKRVEWLSAEAV